MTLKKPCRIHVETVAYDHYHDHVAACMASATLKEWADKYELKLYITDIDQLHLSFYLAFNALNVVSNNWHVHPPAAASRLLFRIMLPVGTIPGRITAQWQPYGISIFIFKNIFLKHNTANRIPRDVVLLSPVHYPLKQSGKSQFA